MPLKTNIFIVLLLFSGCMSDTKQVIVKLTYNSASSSKLYYAAVVSGVDKFFWYNIIPNKTQTITLHPGEHTNTQVTLLYKLSVDKPIQTWNDKDIHPRTDYCIHIIIHKNGKIAKSSCD